MILSSRASDANTSPFGARAKRPTGPTASAKTLALKPGSSCSGSGGSTTTVAATDGVGDGPGDGVAV